MREGVAIRPETPDDFEEIAAMVLRSFREGTDYSDGTDVVALIDEIRSSRFYLPDLSFVAELNGTIVGHFMFSRFPLSETATGGYIDADGQSIAMLAPVAVHADHLHEGIGSAMLTTGLAEAKKHGFRGVTVEGDFHF